MSENNNAPIEATPEQVIYANILNKGMLVGLITLFITFGIYAFGIMDPYIPVDKISEYWSMGVNDYLQTTKIPNGWGWTGMLQYGDFLNFIGVAILSGITILCYLAIIPTLLKNNDKVYAVIAILEVIVLSLAASGILASGH